MYTLLCNSSSLKLYFVRYQSNESQILIYLNITITYTWVRHCTKNSSSLVTLLLALLLAPSVMSFYKNTVIVLSREAGVAVAQTQLEIWPYYYLESLPHQHHRRRRHHHPHSKFFCH